MSLAHPEAACREIGFTSAVPLEEESEVALEDYARALARARGAEAVRAAGDAVGVRAVHVCSPEAALTESLRRDVEDFARSLATGRAGGGLGWS